MPTEIQTQIRTLVREHCPRGIKPAHSHEQEWTDRELVSRMCEGNDLESILDRHGVDPILTACHELHAAAECGAE